MRDLVALDSSDEPGEREENHGDRIYEASRRTHARPPACLCNGSFLFCTPPLCVCA
jgi:hypothetical protein